MVADAELIQALVECRIWLEMNVPNYFELDVYHRICKVIAGLGGEE